MHAEPLATVEKSIEIELYTYQSVASEPDPLVLAHSSRSPQTPGNAVLLSMKVHRGHNQRVTEHHIRINYTQEVQGNVICVVYSIPPSIPRDRPQIACSATTSSDQY